MGKEKSTCPFRAWATLVHLLMQHGQVGGRRGLAQTSSPGTVAEQTQEVGRAAGAGPGGTVGWWHHLRGWRAQVSTGHHSMSGCVLRGFQPQRAPDRSLIVLRARAKPHMLR